VVGAIVVIIGAGVAVWAIGGSGDEATPNGGLAQPGTDPVEGDSSDLRQAGGSSAADSGVIPMSGGGNDPPPATDPDPPIDTRPALSAQDADAMLLRQLDGVATDDTALRRAARDTAELIYAMNGMAAAARARAAYVLANVFLVENDGPTCELWIQRAIDLRPDFPAYRTFVNSCRARSQ
jgi:hypothetical protein